MTRLAKALPCYALTMDDFIKMRKKCEQLKAENEKLQDVCNIDSDILGKMHLENQKLREHNEQLKATLDVVVESSNDIEKKLRERVAKLGSAIDIFNNRRKLAYSLREESAHVYSFVEAIGIEMDKALAHD